MNLKNNIKKYLGVVVYKGVMTLSLVFGLVVLYFFYKLLKFTVWDTFWLNDTLSQIYIGSEEFFIVLFIAFCVSIYKLAFFLGPGIRDVRFFIFSEIESWLNIVFVLILLLVIVALFWATIHMLPFILSYFNDY